MTNTILGIYALLLAVGGVMGYKKARSKQSLIMGLISAAVVAGGLYLTTAVAPICGYSTIAIMSGILIIVFFIRFQKTKSFMPAGLLLLLSLVALIVSLRQVIHF